jgi:hypothetical protein
MADRDDDGVGVLRALWAAEGQSDADLDDACGPQKTCKNMTHVTFDGFAEPGADVGTAWRDKLAREGKLSARGGSVRDLVLGPDEPGR